LQSIVSSPLGSGTENKFGAFCYRTLPVEGK